MKIGDRIHVLDTDGDPHEGEIVEMKSTNYRYSVGVVLDGDPEILFFLPAAVHPGAVTPE